MNKDFSDKDYIKLLEGALNHVSEAIYTSNPRGEIVFINKEAEITDGLNKSEILGKKEEEIYGTSNHAEVIKNNKPILNEKITYTTKKDTIKFVHHSVYPCLMDKGEIGSFSVSKDITKVDTYISKIYQLQQELKTRELKAAKNGTTYTFEDIIGKSLPMLNAIKMAQRAAQFQTNVLICGETGTGKELFAQGIHNASAYKDEPFVGINCAAVPENLLESTLFGTVKGAFTGATDTKGLFEQAAKGSVFLDEIDSMPQGMQAKLLRAIQEKRVRKIGGKDEIPINCRIISATNLDIDKAISENIIRSDIYYRLASVVIEIPPLRKRKGDGSLLSRHFIAGCKKLYGTSIDDIDLEAETYFTKYNWPGNVRELEHLIEGIVILAGENEKTITVRHLPEQIRNAYAKEIKLNTASTPTNIDLNTIMNDYERALILTCLKENNNNISAAARHLGIHRNALYSKIKKLGISI
ncbi:MAG: sigma 54-interacting transcriptional regulator [Clostridiales bacterium]